MAFRYLPAAYFILSGASVLTLWPILIGTGQVTEFETAPFSMTFHLIAEFTMALAGIVTGIGLLLKKRLFDGLLFTVSDMFLWATVNAAHYYLVNFDPAMFWYLSASFVLALVIAVVGYFTLEIAGDPDDFFLEGISFNKLFLFTAGLLYYGFLNLAGIMGHQGSWRMFAMAMVSLLLCLALFGIALTRIRDSADHG